MVTKFEQTLILEFLQYLQYYKVAMAWVVLQALLKCSKYLNCLKAYFSRQCSFTSSLSASPTDEKTRKGI